LRLVYEKISILLINLVFAGQAFADNSQTSWASDTQKLQQNTTATGVGELMRLAANADPVAAVESKALGYASSQLESAGKSWLERVFPTSELYLGLSDPGKPTFGVLVLAPLSNPDDTKNTFFTQDSIYRFDDRTTVNIGLGYRRLEMDDKLLLGVNAFYDHEFPYDHGRTSLGFEARTTVAEINVNRYWGVTGWKDGRDGLQERALVGTMQSWVSRFLTCLGLRYMAGISVGKV